MPLLILSTASYTPLVAKAQQPPQLPWLFTLVIFPWSFQLNEAGNAAFSVGKGMGKPFALEFSDSGNSPKFIGKEYLVVL